MGTIGVVLDRFFTNGSFSRKLSNNKKAYNKSLVEVKVSKVT